MSGKDSFKLRPEAAIRSDSLYLFGQGNLIVREKSGKRKGILKVRSVTTMIKS